MEGKEPPAERPGAKGRASPQWRGEVGDDPMEERATPRRDDNFRHLSEETRSVQLNSERSDLAQETIDLDEVGAQVRAADDALESLHPGQRQVARRGDGPRHLARLTARPAAGASAGKTELEQHRETALQPGAVQRALEKAHLRRRVDKAVEVELGIALQLARHPPDGGRLHQLVREDYPATTESSPDADLPHRRGGDGPSASAELPPGEATSP